MPLHFVIFNSKSIATTFGLWKLTSYIVGDYIGRTYLASYSALNLTSPRRILFLSLGRTLFIPVFFACNVTPREVGNTPFINSDILYFLIILLFSMTNGYVPPPFLSRIMNTRVNLYARYLGSLCMVVSSSPDLNPRIKADERDVAATLASFCLVAGLAAGSLASFAVGAAVNRAL